MGLPYSTAYSTVDSWVVDDLRADIAQLEDQILGLEHDLTLVAEILRAGGATICGPDLQFDVTVMGGRLRGRGSAHLTEDQQAVVERLLLLWAP